MENMEILEGDLIFENFPNLQTIDLSDSRITSLVMKNCQELSSFYASDSNLTKLSIVNCKKLKTLSLNRNPKLTTFDLSGSSNLVETLSCANNNLTSLNLENLVNLKDLV